MQESHNTETGTVTLTFDSTEDAETFKVLEQYAKNMGMDVESEEFSELLSQSLTTQLKKMVE
jgi:hypothetical protein